MRLSVGTTAALLVSAWAGVAHATPLCDWQWVNPNPPRTDILRLKYEVGVFVGVGRAGTVIRSQDGFAWSAVASGVADDLYGIDWGAGRFVAVGDGVVLTSPAGLAWTEVYRSADGPIVDVEYSASRFVAVGPGLGDAVLTSVDGSDWQLVQAAWTGSALSIAGSNDGFYVAVGNEIWFSGDGLQWERIATVPAVDAVATPGSLTKKTGSSLFNLDRVDLAWTGSRLFWASGDELWSTVPGGDTWTLDASLGGCFPFSDWLGLAGGDNWLIASGISGCPTPYLEPTVTILISTDGGASFHAPWQADLGGFPALARCGSRWVAAGSYGDVIMSTDAANWACNGSGCTSLACEDGFFDLTADNDGWLASGGVGICGAPTKRRGGGTTAYSHNGSAWQVEISSLERIRGAAATEGGYLAVGDGWTARSQDGHAWVEESAPDGAFLSAVAAHDGWEVVVGNGGALYVAEGGPGWFEPYLFVTEDLHRVVWGDSQFVVLGENGLVMRSVDVLNWLTAAAATTVDLYGAAAGPDVWVAVGAEGTILSSQDAKVWLAERSPVDAMLTDVTWGDGRFVAVGWQEGDGDARPAVLISSSNGIHWTRFPVPAESLERVAWSDEFWIVAGGNRTLMRADCLGLLIEPEVEHLQVPMGETVHLVVDLSSPAPVDGVLTVSSSKPGRVGVVPTVSVTAGEDRIFVPVTGVAPEQNAVLTLSLPEALGGGVTSMLVSVQPPEWTPRTPSGRVTP